MRLRTPQHPQEARQAAEALAVDLGAQKSAHALPDTFRAQAQAPSVRGLAAIMSVASGETVVSDHGQPTVDLGVGHPFSVDLKSMDYPKSLPDETAVADFVISFDGQGAREDWIRALYAETTAMLRLIPVALLRQGSGCIRHPSLEKRYAGMNPETVPPLIVDLKGNVLDGNHRFRVLKRAGAKSVWCYELSQSGQSSRIPPLAEWMGAPPVGAPEVPWQQVREHIQQTNPHRGRRDDRNALNPDNNDPVSGYRWYGPVAIDLDDPLVRVLAATHPEDVEAYKRRFLEGSEFPVIAMIWGDSWRTEGQLVVYDGAHRLQAALECGASVKTYIGVRKGSAENQRKATQPD